MGLALRYKNPGNDEESESREDKRSSCTDSDQIRQQTGASAADVISWKTRECAFAARSLRA